MNTTDRWNASEAVSLPGFGLGGQPLPASARPPGATGELGVQLRFRGGQGTGPVSFRIGENYALRADEYGREQSNGPVRATAHLFLQMAVLSEVFTTFTTKPITGPRTWRPPA
jgi:hypothetical protein